VLLFVNTPAKSTANYVLFPQLAVIDDALTMGLPIDSAMAIRLSFDNDFL
jgi:hypothetical protein